MRLDRNTNNESGRGKYALLRLRNTTLKKGEIDKAITDSIGGQVLLFGDTPHTEFFVVKLMDKYAAPALMAYADAAAKDDPEYAEEIRDLARRAETHPGKKNPD